MKKWMACFLVLMFLLPHCAFATASVSFEGMELAYVGNYDYYLNGVKQTYYLPHSESKGTLNQTILPLLKQGLAEGTESNRSQIGSPVMLLHLQKGETGYLISLQKNGFTINRLIYEKGIVNYIDENGETQTKPGYTSQKDTGFAELVFCYGKTNYTEKIEDYLLQHIREVAGIPAQQPQLLQVSDFQKLYSASFTEQRIPFEWGLCSYQLNGTRKYHAYFYYNNHYYLGQFQEQNTVTFDTAHWIFGNKYYKGTDADDSFGATISFKADKQYRIYELQLLFKQHGKEQLFQPDMMDYAETGNLEAYPAFAFRLDDFQVDYTSFLTDGTLQSVSYRYLENGESKTVSRSRTQLNVDNIESKFHVMLAAFPFTESDLSTDTSDAVVQMHFRQEGKNATDLYFLSSHLVLVKETDEGRYAVSYPYGETRLLTQLESLLAHWKEEYISSRVTYIDLSTSEYTPQYVADFQLVLSDTQKSSWLGEVSENGTVKCQITYFRESPFETGRPAIGMVTVSGNGKTFHLMEDGYRRADAYMKYTSERIGVAQDTPLPNQFAENGVLALSWKYPSEFTSTESLTALLFDENGKQIGTEISVIGKTEMRNLLEKPDTPVLPAPEKSQVFADVTATHWAHQTIENFYYANIIRGTGENQFSPEDSLTYEHFGFLLQRLFRYSYENTEQLPAKRQDVIAALVKALHLENNVVTNTSGLSSVFADYQEITEENLPLLKIAYENGLMIGSDGYLYPEQELTRAEAVTLLDRGIRKIYGITQEDAPEWYRFKIKPIQSEYSDIEADLLTEFRLWNGVSHDVLVRDASRLKGKVQISFGENLLSDTKVAAVCMVDNDIYTIDSLSYDALYFRTGFVHLECTVSIFKNGEIYDANQALRILADQEENTFTLGLGEHLIAFENVNFHEGKFPKTPEKQPYEEKETIDGTIYISTDFDKLQTEAVTMTEEITGYWELRSDGKKASFQTEISAYDASGLQYSYRLTLKECKELTDNVLKGIFLLESNGITTQIPGSITGLSGKVGERLLFSSNDQSFLAEAIITEISK